MSARLVLTFAALVAAAAAPAAAQPAPVIPPTGMTGPAPKTPGTAPAPAPKKNETAAPAVTVTLAPRAWARSVYNFEGRLESAIQDVTFETPPAYHENFAFWANRMKGTQRIELIQYVTSTQDAAESGEIPFHRKVTRYMLDLNEHGQVKTMGGKLNRDVELLAWDGRLDPKGRLLEAKRVAGPEDMTEVERLSFPLLEHVLPVLDAPRPVKTGESFTVESTLPLPSRLSIAGLENTAARLTRVLTFREMRGRQAVFAVKASYALDPTTPPTAERTTCVIGGGGDGEAIYDLDGGFFTSSRVATKMTIDIEAPLRALPSQPEGTDPGTGKSHLVLVLTMSGKQTATQLFGGESAVSGAADPKE